jgi:hypothetical protein
MGRRRERNHAISAGPSPRAGAIPIVEGVHNEQKKNITLLVVGARSAAQKLGGFYG